eukprot:Clim_evm19s171 gene=Clim_evmTU19s171
MSQGAIDVSAMMAELTVKEYASQAKFFLNAYWKQHGETEAENIWNVYHKMVELDDKKRHGCELDEFQAHRLLEAFGEPLTVLEMRERMREIDLNSNKKVSMVEYLLWRYQHTPDDMCKREQTSSVALDKAEAALETVQAEIEAIENKKTELRKKSEGEGVRAKMAAAELAQLEAADPLALNRALVEAEAAVRKARKSDVSPGTMWWLDREIEEAKRYKPRGGVKAIA